MMYINLRNNVECKKIKWQGLRKYVILIKLKNNLKQNIWLINNLAW